MIHYTVGTMVYVGTFKILLLGYTNYSLVEKRFSVRISQYGKKKSKEGDAARVIGVRLRGQSLS